MFTVIRQLTLATQTRINRILRTETKNHRNSRVIVDTIDTLRTGLIHPEIAELLQSEEIDSNWRDFINLKKTDEIVTLQKAIFKEIFKRDPDELDMGITLNQFVTIMTTLTFDFEANGKPKAVWPNQEYIDSYFSKPVQRVFSIRQLTLAFDQWYKNNTSLRSYPAERNKAVILAVFEVIVNKAKMSDEVVALIDLALILTWPDLAPSNILSERADMQEIQTAYSVTMLEKEDAKVRTKFYEHELFTILTSLPIPRDSRGKPKAPDAEIFSENYVFPFKEESLAL